MYYLSTRGNQRLTAAEAITQGLARDGGLMTPEVFMKMSPSALDTMKDMSYPQRAVYVMSTFLDEFSTAELNDFAKKAYGPDKFDTPLVAPVCRVDDNTYCLELWHGPTCAFKDMALQMLPHLLTASLKKIGERKRCAFWSPLPGTRAKARWRVLRTCPRPKYWFFIPRTAFPQFRSCKW